MLLQVILGIELYGAMRAGCIVYVYVCIVYAYTINAAVRLDASVNSFIYLHVTLGIGLFAHIIVTRRFLFNNIDVEVNT